MGGVIEGALIREPLEHSEPGVYIAAATDPAYGWLKGLAVEGAARVLGERYEVDGTKLIAVEIPGAELAPNQRAVRYRIGKAFFSAALDDYKDWKEKWWREAIQNAVDAGATQVDCRVEQVAEGISVSCADNGRGMDPDTIENKFLVGGETTKTAATGEAGGFGKAKELLILPWIAWSMHSRAARFYGSGDEGVMEDAPYRDGVELRVVMPTDNTTSAEAAMEFIGKCSLPGVRFTVNGQEYRADLDPGEEITDFHSKAVLFHNKRATKRWKVLVRTKGLYMFSFAYLPSGLEGSLTLELVGRSKDLLTANRDGFRDEQLAHDVDQFVRKVSVDIESALEKKKNHFNLRFEGSGKFAGAPESELQATMLSHLEEIVPQRQPGGRIGTLSSNQIQVLTEIIASMSGGESVDDEEKEGGEMNLRTTPEIAAALLDGIPMGGTDAVEAAIRQLSWEPDFFMSNKVDGFEPPKMFYPKTMTASMRKLAKLWAELCRFVLIQLGSKERFGVGWIFAERTGAAYQALPDKDEHWLLFNPFKRPRSFEYSRKPAKEDLYNPSDDDDLAWLYASAIHECTHMADGFDEHDESFAAAFTRNVAKIAGKERQIRAIRKAVLARGPKKASAPRRPAAPKGLRELPPLANANDEEERRQATLRGGYRYAMFVGQYDSHKEDFSDDLASETLARHRGVRDVEWRDKQARGAAVWRSTDFSVPLASARESLPELSDEWLRTRRQEDARDYKSYGTDYVAFKNDSTSVWDYGRNLNDVIRTMAAETGGSDYAEIRAVATGEPVWRSANFGQSLMRLTSNAKSARQLEAQRAQASMIRGTAQEKIRGHRERITELDTERRAELGRINRFARSARARTVLEPTSLVRGDRCYLASEERQAELRRGVDTFYDGLRSDVSQPLDAEEARLRADIERTRDITALQTGTVRKTSGALRGMRLREEQAESDDAVEHEIDPSLVPLWRIVKRRFVETPKMSRSEAFQHWVDEHPEEVTALLEQRVAPLVRALEREQWGEEARAAAERGRQQDEDEHRLYETEPSPEEIVEGDDPGETPFN